VGAEPAVHGPVVTVTNDKVFDEAVYNYTRDFPYLWEEIAIPVRYGDDRTAVERILLESARRHTVKVAEMSAESLQAMRERYFVRDTDLEAQVYLRLTDNWVELTVRFVTAAYGVRDLKDAMSREVLDALDEAGIGLASATYEIVGVPRLQVVAEPSPDGRRAGAQPDEGLTGSGVMGAHDGPGRELA
jgi:small-conductance mechanosensitive channel